MIKPAKRTGFVKRIPDPYQRREDFLCLDRNERLFTFSDSFFKGLKEKITSNTVNRYPEPQPLYERLAAWLGLTAAHVYICAGSEYGIKAICESYIQQEDRVLLHSPGYALFEIYSRLAGGKIQKQKFRPDLSFNLVSYREKINSNIKMAVLENPNGFIGAGFSLSEVEAFIHAAHSNGALAVVDEAYCHFHGITVVDLIRKYDNLIVLRTFSKAMGAAGIRMGYLVASKDIISNIKKVRPMHEITHFTLVAALYILDHIEEMEAYISSIREYKRFLIDSLSELGILCQNTATNFILVKWPMCKNIENSFRGEGILLRRPFTQSYLSGWSRVSIGNREQIEQLLNTVKKILR